MDDATKEKSAYEGLKNDHHRAFIDLLAAGRFQHEAYHDSIFYKGKYRGKRTWETGLPDEGKTAESIYYTCAVNASVLLKNTKYREAWRERCAERVMSREEALARFADEGRNIQAAYIQPDGSVDLDGLIKDGYAHLIKGTKHDAKGNLVVEFCDTQGARVQIMKAYDRPATGRKDDPIHLAPTGIDLSHGSPGDRSG